MFTGIIEATGTIKHITRNAKDARLTIASSTLDFSDVKLGDSIAANGVCLTVVDLGVDWYAVDVSYETLRLTGFAHYQAGDSVNLEKAMLPTTRFGGHIVSGHVDGLGTIQKITTHSEYTEIWVEAPSSIAKYICPKGSITVDGVSLTVNQVERERFMLWLIPHTLQQTIIKNYRVNDQVNLEVDMVARYLERLLSYQPSTDKKSTIDMQLLRDNGYA